jgi:hypothetical protein
MVRDSLKNLCPVRGVSLYDKDGQAGGPAHPTQRRFCGAKSCLTFNLPVCTAVTMQTPKRRCAIAHLFSLVFQIIGLGTTVRFGPARKGIGNFLFKALTRRVTHSLPSRKTAFVLFNPFIVSSSSLSLDRALLVLSAAIETGTTRTTASRTCGGIRTRLTRQIQFGMERTIQN